MANSLHFGLVLQEVIKSLYNSGEWNVRYTYRPVVAFDPSMQSVAFSINNPAIFLCA